MSQRNGDKSRFNRVRRQKIRQREKNRALRSSLRQGGSKAQPRQAAKPQ